jgi:hypothetical protein
MVMIVADPVLEARRRSRGLDSPEEALIGQGTQRVVDGLTRYGTELRSDDPVDVVRCAVRSLGHRPQYSQTLSRDLHADTTKELSIFNSTLHEVQSSTGPILD